MTNLPRIEAEPLAASADARRAVRLWLIGAGFWIVTLVILALPLFPAERVAWQVGSVATRDVYSSRRIAFASDILTERQRKEAELSVASIYTLPDGQLARQQVLRARAVTDFIQIIRADAAASPAHKQAAFAKIDGLKLSTTQIERILSLHDEEWARVQDQVSNVLASAMRGEIREDDAARSRARLPIMLDVDLSEDQAAVATALAQPFIVPNTFLDAEATAAARTKARQSVEPVLRSYEAGEIVLREGQIVSAADVEALDQLGLRQTQTGWGDMASALLYATILTMLPGLFVWRFEAAVWNDTRLLLVLAVLLVVFILTAKIMLPVRALLPYLFPAAALPMLLTVLVGPQLAVLAAALMGILAGMLGGGAELPVLMAVSGLVAALTLRRAERLNAFFRVGLYVGLANLAVILAFRLPVSANIGSNMLMLITAGIANSSLAVGLAIGGLYLMGNVLGMTTAWHLQELARLTQPLLDALLLKAPGTYHHARMVANLAEQAAERIGADALLVRVGGFYHDVGKIEQPYMFIENQNGGNNVHDSLDARASAEIIIQHVENGLTLAKRYRLPSRVCDFIREHHGTLRAGYFYEKAVQQAGGDASKVDERTFCYPGPKPQSRETALVMLADGCEAAIRAKRPSTVDEIRGIVHKIIADRVTAGQLNECSLTLNDLESVRESFTRTLQGVFHPRIEYALQEKVAPPPSS